MLLILDGHVSRVQSRVVKLLSGRGIAVVIIPSHSERVVHCDSTDVTQRR